MNWKDALRRTAGRRSHGQIIPLVALLLVCLLGAAALAVDVGYLRFQQRLEQTAADSAALAGAIELQNPGTDFIAAAKADAASNGFDDNAGNIVVSVNNPPQSGPDTGNATAVEVVIVTNYATFFEHVFPNMAFAAVKSRAVAVGGSGALNCFTVMGNGAPNFNQSNLTAPNCGLALNGSLAGNNTTINMSKIGYTNSNWANNFTFPTAKPTKVGAAADPCPTIPGCQYLAAHPPSTSPCDYCNFNQNGGTLNPGVYGGGDNFNGNFTLKSGVYVITSNINFQNATLKGSGVTFYIASGGLNLNNADTTRLFPPTSGNMAGMLIYQPPSNNNQLLLGGKMGNSNNISIVYAPSAEMTLNNAVLTGIDLIIANSNSFNDSTFTFPAGLAVPGASSVALSE